MIVRDQHLIVEFEFDQPKDVMIPENLEVSSEESLIQKWRFAEDILKILGGEIPREDTLGYKFYQCGTQVTKNATEYVLANKAALLTSSNNKAREIAEIILRFQTNTPS